jgi:GNAT superfamily N-acetyltransferase
MDHSGEYRFEVTEGLGPEESRILSEGLTRHALPHTVRPGFQTLAVLLRDDRGLLVGGAWGQVNWNWFSVVVLWLEEGLRGARLGRELMERLERAARERGCEQSHVETFSFQAPAFYEKLGYQVFAVLDDYPPPHRKLFMKKAL